jgi:hypothetical protein
LWLTGCSTFEVSDPVIVATPQERTIYPRPTPLSLGEVQWDVLSAQVPDTYREYFEENGAGFCLAPKAYESLGANMQRILLLIIEQRALIEVYERERAEDNAKVRKLAEEKT